jgi:hypothetical protein
MKSGISAIGAKKPKPKINIRRNKTTAPNQLWQTDFTYLKIIGWGWYYLSTILDDYSRYIISWKLCTTMRADDMTDNIMSLGVAINNILQIDGGVRPPAKGGRGLQAEQHSKLGSIKKARPASTQIARLCYPCMTVSIKRKDSRWFDQCHCQRTRLIDQRPFWPFGRRTCKI